MQDDALKEGNTAIIRLPTKEQTKISPSKTNGRRPKQRLHRGEIHSENAPVVGPMKPNHVFVASGTNFTLLTAKVYKGQPMERQQATLDDDDGKLLQAGRAAKSNHNDQGGSRYKIKTNIIYAAAFVQFHFCSVYLLLIITYIQHSKQ
jgi:hypothetical protein